MMFLTGATGFVGRQVVAALQRENRAVRVVQRAASTAEPPVGPGVEVISCEDVFTAEPAWWSSVLAGVDTVIHLAWFTEPGVYLQSHRNLECMTGTIALARACIEAGVRRFVGVGTCAEYDLTEGTLRTDTPLKPHTLYAASKAAVFHVLGELLPPAGVEFAWCRLFYLYGEGEDPRRLAPYLHRQLAEGTPAELTSGNQIRDFLNVSEAGVRIARAALGECRGALNICSGTPTTVRQFAEAIADTYGRRDLLRFGTRPDNDFDPPRVLGVPTDLRTS